MLNVQFPSTYNPATGSYLLLQFDTSAGFDVSKVQCSSVYGFQTSGVTCVQSSPSQVKVSGLFPRTDVYTLVELSQIGLPAYVNTFSIDMKIYDASNTLKAQSIGSQFTLTTTQGKLSVTMNSLSNQNVGEFTNLEISITNQNTIPKDGRVQIKLPKWNSGTQNVNKVQSMISYSTTSDTFNVSEMGFQIDCSSSAHPNLKCIFSVQSVTTVSQIGSSFDTLIINGFSSDTASNAGLQLSINNNRFKNPPSTKPLNTIQVYTMTSGKLIIDQALSVTYQVQNPYSMTNSQVSITLQELEINRQTQYDFKITIPLPLPVGASIKIIIPSQVSIKSGTTQILSSAEGQNPLYKQLQLSIIDSATQQISLSNLVPTSQYYVDEGTMISFTLFSLQNPASNGKTDGFKIDIYDSEYLMMSLPISQGVYVQAKEGYLSNVQITPDSYRVRAVTTYTFSMKNLNSIPSNGGIEIKLPEQMSFYKTNANLKAVINTKDSSSITYDESSKTINIKSCIISKGVQSDQTLKFQLSGIINPYSTSKSGTLTLQTLDDLGNVIDSNNTVSITATPNEIPSVTVTPCSNLPVSQTSVICTYTLNLNFGASYPILANSYLEIELPLDLQIPNIHQTLIGTKTQGIDDALIKVSISSGILRIDKGFSQKSTDYVISSFKVNIDQILTPRSTQPSGSFKVRVYDVSGNIQYKKESMITSRVSEASQFKKVVMTRSSDINGIGNVTYNFSLQLNSLVYRGEWLKIVAPSGVYIKSSRDQCKGTLGLQTALGCSVNQNSLYLALIPNDTAQATFQVGTTLNISISNFVNPISLQPTDSFQIYVSSSRDYDYYINQQTTGLSILNKWPGNLTNVQIVPDSNKLGAETNYAFYFTLGTEMKVGSYIEVFFPSKLYPKFQGAISCVFIKNIDQENAKCQVKQYEKQVIQIVGGITKDLNQGTEIAFKILYIKNPAKSLTTNNSTDNIVITTYTSNNYIVDQTFNLNFRVGCQFPCASCQTDQSQCTSCLPSDDTSPSTSQLFLYGTKCGKTCPTGYYDDNQFVCQKCSYPCFNCMTNATKCTQCSKNTQTPYLNYDDNKCYSQCPSGMFSSESNLECEKCSSNCKECQFTPNKCTQCLSSKYIWEAKCFDQCPNTTVPLNSTQVKECQSCKAPCATCSGTRDNCTSCQLSPNIYYLYENQCLESCPRMYLPNENNVCVKSDETVYPFLSFVVSGTVFFIIFVSNKIYPNTRLLSGYLALQSFVMIFLWIYLFLFLLKDQHRSSAGLVAFGLFSNFLINCFWHAYYSKKIVKLDNGYQRYQKEHPFAYRLIVFLSFITTFQLFRVQYSRLFNFEAFSCTLEMKDKFYLKLNRYSLMQLTFVYLPILASNVYNLNWTWYGRQVFWVDLESIITSFFLLLVHVIVIKRTEHLFVQDKYQVQNIEYGQAPDHTQVLGQTTVIDELGPNESGKKSRNYLEKLAGIQKSLNSLEGLDDLEESSSREITGLNKNVKVPHRVINDKEYVTLGSLNQNKKVKRTMIHGVNSDLYNRIDQETSRTLVEGEIIDTEGVSKQPPPETILAEFEYTSAPLNVDGILKSSSPARQKFKEFQRELDNYVKNAKDKKVSKVITKTPKAKNQRSPSPSKALKNQASQKKSAEKVRDYRRKSSPIKKPIWNTNENPKEDLPQKSKNLIQVEDQQAEENDIIQEDKQLPTVSDDQIIDPKDFNKLKEDLILHSIITDQQATFLQDLNQDVTNIDQIYHQESAKKEELSVLVDDLRHQIDKLLNEFKDAAKKREEELALIEGTNYTEDEDEMGVTPSAFNLINQRDETPVEASKEVKRGRKNVSMARETFIADENDAVGPNVPRPRPKVRASTSPGGKKKSMSPSAKVRSKKGSPISLKRNNVSPSPNTLTDSKPQTARQKSLGATQSLKKDNFINDQQVTDKKSKSKSKSPKRNRKSKSKSRKSKSKSKNRKSRSRSPRKSKKSRGRKSKKRGSKSKKSRSKSPKQKKAQLVNSENEALKMFSMKPVDTYESNTNENDVDQLSVEMTQDEFVKMLEEDRGLFILEDLSDQFRDQFFKDYQPSLEENAEFTNQSKQILKQLAYHQLAENADSRLKLKEFIQSLSQLGKVYFEQASQQDQVQVFSQEYPTDQNLAVTQDDLLPKTKLKKNNTNSNRSNLQGNGRTFDAYFNYLPFEKAVIESKGRTPYTNRDVEKLVNQKKGVKVVPINDKAEGGSASGGGTSIKEENPNK